MCLQRWSESREAAGDPTNFYEADDRRLDSYQPSIFYEVDGASTKEFAEFVDRSGLDPEDADINSMGVGALDKDGGGDDASDSEEEEDPYYDDARAADLVNDLDVDIGSKVFIMEGRLAVLQGEVLAESEEEFQDCRVVEVGSMQ
jgi:hypothetical protein